MKALLDTHTFLWWIADPSFLSPTVHDIIMNGDYEIFLSVATIWEIAIKVHKGRLVLPDTLENIVATVQALYHFSILPIQISHTCRVISLPDHHSDPFDRLLIAQCQAENMVLLSIDKIIPNYDVKVIWD